MNDGLRSQHNGARYRLPRSRQTKRDHDVGPKMMKWIAVIALLACLGGCGTAGPEPTPPRLALVQIVRDPFILKWDGRSDLPVGTHWHGFVVAGLTPKFKMRTLPNGKEVEVDVSELTLKRSGKTITLVKGRRTEYNGYFVHLVSDSDQKEYTVGIGQELEIGSRRLRLRELNVKELNCTLEDINSGEHFKIKRVAQQKAAR